MSPKPSMGAHSEKVAKGGQTEAQEVAQQLLELHDQFFRLPRKREGKDISAHAGVYVKEMFLASVVRGQKELLKGIIEGKITVGTPKIDEIMKKTEKAIEDQYLSLEHFPEGSIKNMQDFLDLSDKVNRLGMNLAGNPLGGRALGIESPAK